MKRASLKNLTEADVERLELLSHVGKRINTRASFGEALEAVLDSVVNALEAERGAVFLVKEEGRFPVLELALDKSQERDREFGYSRTVVERVWNEKQPLAVVDAQDHEDFAAVNSIQVEGIRSLMCVPLEGHHSTLGLIYLDNRISNAFTGPDLQMLDIIADLAATALERARFFEALKSLNDRLEATVEERTREAEQARRVAERATEAKSLFLANMSHELRTPLNGILGLTEDLLRAQRTPGMRMVLEQIGYSARSLATLVNAILDFSKIESGRIELDVHPFSLEKALRSALATVAYTAQDKGLEMIVEVEPDVPAEVEGDSTRLKQILINLLANAVKFTPQGWVRLRVEMADPDRIWFRVADSGIGIPEEKRKVIFEPFSQGDASTTRQYGGTGLGLSICRSLTELMGARLELESEPGKGTEFHFKVPLKTLKAYEAPNLVGVRISLQDSQLGHRRALAATLESWGAVLTPAVADSQLAVTDTEPDQTRVPYILLTTNQQISRSDLTLSDNARLLLKPVLRQELAQAVAALGGDLAPAPVADTVDHPCPSPGSELLVADDNDINRLVLERMVAGWGYTTRSAGSGRAVLLELEKRAPRMILMDIDMPELDGYTAAQMIRAKEVQEGRSPVPIIAVTAHLAADLRQRCVEAGMDDLLPKPISRAKLARRLRRWENVLCGNLSRRQVRSLEHPELAANGSRFLSEIHGLLSTLQAMVRRGAGPALDAALLRLQQLSFAAGLMGWGGRLVSYRARGDFSDVHDIVTEFQQEWKTLAPTLVSHET